MISIEESLGKYNWPKRNKSSKLSVSSIENNIGFSLPEDYRNFLNCFHGDEAFIGPEFVRLWDVEELREMSEGYQIIENLPFTLAIGTNGAAEFIGIEKSTSGTFRIVLSPFIDLNSKFHIEIGSSFTDFLVRLGNNHAWFRVEE